MRSVISEHVCVALLEEGETIALVVLYVFILAGVLGRQYVQRIVVILAAKPSFLDD